MCAVSQISDSGGTLYLYLAVNAIISAMKLAFFCLCVFGTSSTSWASLKRTLSSEALISAVHCLIFSDQRWLYGLDLFMCLEITFVMILFDISKDWLIFSNWIQCLKLSLFMEDLCAPVLCFLFLLVEGDVTAVQSWTEVEFWILRNVGCWIFK